MKPKIIDVKVDRLDRVYTLYDNNKLTVSNNRNLPTYVYANNQQGQIDHVDVTNPLKVLLFFKDFMQIKVLDNTLSDVASINLNQLQYDDVRIVGASNDNNIWIYDAATYRLIKINDSGKEITSSINLAELSFTDWNPVFIRENNNRVYLVDSIRGVIIFDNFGQFIQRLPITGTQEIYIDGNRIIYQLDKALIAYNTRLFTDEKITLPEMIDTSYFKVIPSPTQYVFAYRDSVIVLPR